MNRARSENGRRALIDTADKLKKQLAGMGLTREAIDAAWPQWWTDTAEQSLSALSELKFAVARQLGIDPRSLLGAGPPAFIWEQSAKYKNFTGSDRERAAIASFGSAAARHFLNATPSNENSWIGRTAQELREAILRTSGFVDLRSLLAMSWALGVPVVHLRVFPLAAKRMCAMSVPVGSRQAILMARDSLYPPWAAFHLAHEIGHIALGHLKDGSPVIDMADASDGYAADDEEEIATDHFALTLLTGHATLTFDVDGAGRRADELARQLLSYGRANRIEPGSLALCFGKQTGDWALASATIAKIYSEPRPVWLAINEVAAQQLDLSSLPSDAQSYVTALMGRTP